MRHAYKLVLVKFLLMILLMMMTSSVLAATLLLGKVHDSDALIALVFQAEELIVYVCGGSEDWQTHSSWFQGSWDAQGEFSLSGQDGLSIEGKWSGRAARGILRLTDGSTASWQALAAQDDSSAGLYRLADDERVAGFIVLAGESVGSIRLIRPAAAFVLPLRLEAGIDIGRAKAVRLCYSLEAKDYCFEAPKFGSAP